MSGQMNQKQLKGDKTLLTWILFIHKLNCLGKPPWTYLQTEASTYLTLSQETEAVNTGSFRSIEGLIHLQTLLPDSCPWQKNLCFFKSGEEVLPLRRLLLSLSWEGDFESITASARCCLEASAGAGRICATGVLLSVSLKALFRLRGRRKKFLTDSLHKKKGVNFVVTLFEHLPMAA